jgi:hypothetical protein
VAVASVKAAAGRSQLLWLSPLLWQLLLQLLSLSAYA